MANTLTTEMSVILGHGLESFMGAVTMPGAVYTDLSAELANPGQQLSFNVPQSVGTKAITPSNTQPAPADTTTAGRTLTLDQHRGSNPFKITHKERQEVRKNGAVMIDAQLGQSAVDLAEELNLYLHNLYPYIYNVAGTAGTTPFASTVAGATLAIKRLSEAKAKIRRGQMFGVLDPSAAANFKALSEFADADRVGSNELKIAGIMGERYGVRWLEDQAVVYHTAGVPGGTPLVNGALAAGVSSVAIDGGGASGTYKRGDIVTFAGHTQTYSVQADVTLNGSGVGTLTISPPLKSAVADNAAITLTASHRVNLVFNRRAIYLAQRALGNPDPTNFVEITDEATNLSLRLEHMHQYKQEAWEYDLLYGAAVIYPEYAVRLMG